MAKLLILDGDDVEADLKFSNDRFLFLITKTGKVYYIDLTEEKMFGLKEMNQLGPKHQEVIYHALN